MVGLFPPTEIMPLLLWYIVPWLIFSKRKKKYILLLLKHFATLNNSPDMWTIRSLSLGYRGWCVFGHAGRHRFFKEAVIITGWCISKSTENQFSMVQNGTTTVVCLVAFYAGPSGYAKWGKRVILGFWLVYKSAITALAPGSDLQDV